MNDHDRVPPAAALIRAFVNTREPQTGEELFTNPSALRQWLLERELIGPDSELSDADLAATRGVREGLRSVLLDHAGHAADPAAMAVLNRTMAAVPVRAVFDDGDVRLVSATDDPLGVALGGLLDAVRRSREDGSWPRLKVCARSTCRWAFYDASRNHVRRWCSMAGCGNHVKMQRAYATRRRRDQQPIP